MFWIKWNPDFFTHLYYVCFRLNYIKLTMTILTNLADYPMMSQQYVPFHVLFQRGTATPCQEYCWLETCLQPEECGGAAAPHPIKGDVFSLLEDLILQLSNCPQSPHREAAWTALTLHERKWPPTQPLKSSRFPVLPPVDSDHLGAPEPQLPSQTLPKFPGSRRHRR